MADPGGVGHGGGEHRGPGGVGHGGGEHRGPGGGAGFHAEGASTPPAHLARRGAPVALALVLAGAAGALVLRLAGAAWEAAIAVTLLGPLVVWVLCGGKLADLGLRRPGRGLAVLAAGGAVAAAVVAGVASLAAGLGLLAFAPADLAPGERGGRLLTAVVAGVLVAGVGEELVFRGAVLRLVAAWRGAVLAVAASGGLFAVAHVPNLLDQGLAGPGIAARLAALAALGGALAVAAWRTGSLWLPIGWHAGANLVNEGARAFVTAEPAAPAWLVGTGDALARGGVLGLVLAAAEVALLLVVAGWVARRG